MADRAFVMRRWGACHRARRDRRADLKDAPTVLVADSNLIGRNGVARLLFSQGYKVVKASDGAEALALVQLGGIDLLVSAMIMSGMDGLELLRAVRDLGIEFPVIAVSSGSETIDGIYLKAASLLGATWTCLQPMQASGFLGHVRDLLNSPAERRARRSRRLYCSWTRAVQTNR